LAQFPPIARDRPGESTIAALAAAGAGAGRVVAAVTASAARLETLIHATAALGAPLFPMDPALPDDVIASLCRSAGVAVMVADRDLPGMTRLAGAGLDAVTPSRPSCYRPGSIALLVATSGSSGRPKPVMLSAGALAAAARASHAVTPLRAGDRWLGCLPLFHIGGYSILSRCRLAGATPILLQGFDAERVLHHLTAEAVTHLSLVPAMLSRLLDLATAPPPPGLRHVLVGGAALGSELAARAAEQGWPIQPTYGMSEMASQVATLPALPRPWPPGLVGSPIPGAELALTPDGRLKVRGPMMMAGYANPGLTPGDGLEDGWFVTSDLAEIGATGQLTIRGRGDEVIVSGGKKILPGMVEEALANCPGIDDVAVTGTPDPVWGAVVTAIVRGEASGERILHWCRENVSPLLRPRRVIKVAALPCLSNGKPDRVALRRLAEQHI